MILTDYQKKAGIMENYIPLPLKLRKNGFNYTQLLRGRRSLIYRQRVSSHVEYFEVFVKRIQPEKEIFGKTIPAKEKFPSNEDFGYHAWTFRNYDDTLWRFNELEQGKERKDFTFPNSNKRRYQK